MKYLILGGNAAGMSFAAKMRRNDSNAEIVVIEKNDYVSFGACGLPYYVGNSFADVNNMIVRTPEQFVKENIDLRINEEAININFAEKKVFIKNENKEYEETYDKLLITTGASPIKIPVNDSKGIFTLTTKNDGEKLKNYIENNSTKNIAILGTGFIGLEIMDELKNTTHKLKLITKDKHFLNGQYDEKLITTVENDVENLPNIEIFFENTIEKITYNQEADKYLINLDQKIIEVDAVIMALGFRPNTNFIADIDKLGNGAIKVNQNCETSQKDVYAVGDCATVYNKVLKEEVYLPLATSANKVGKMLADLLADKKIAYSGMLGSSCIKILDYEVARTGLTKIQLENSSYKFKEKIIEDMNQTSYYEGQEKITIKLYYEEETLRILGAEMVGKKGVVGRIGALAVAIDQQVTTEELGYIDFPYSPPFSRTWDALNIAGNVSK